MAAEYTGRYKYDPITGRPLTKPKWYLLGVEVDQETYSRYATRIYTLGAYNTSLIMVRHYATEQHAKEYPIEAESARKILAQIREEITTKGENAVTEKKRARDFIDALAELYTECRTAYEAQQNALAKAEAWMEATRKEASDINCQNRQLAEIRYFAAKAEWQLTQDEVREEVVAIQDSFSAKVRELRGQFEGYLAEHYSASPDKLDTATMQLLNSGICTAAELARLAERHKDNPTMLRMVGSYAKKIVDTNALRGEEAFAYRQIMIKAYAAKDGSREMNIFDSAASAAERGLRKDSEVADKMHVHIVGWFDSFRNQIEDIPNAPAEISAGGE